MSETGLVTSRHRRHIVTETAGGERVQCIVRGRQLKPLVGDTVAIERLDDGTTVIAAIEARRSLLNRIDSRGRPEGIAANITQLAVVVASRPEPDWVLVDRYFAAAELQKLAGLLVWNKSDLAALDTASRAGIYGEIGYTVIETAAAESPKIAGLDKALAGQRSVLVGQSGVGKSSLINALVGETAQAVGKLSERKALGRHTTTAAELYRLPGGGELIDSPGVRQYAPYLTDPEQLEWGFREFHRFLGQCKFDNCRHAAEPGCRIKQAVDDGDIHRERLASYLALREALADLAR